MFLSNILTSDASNVPKYRESSKKTLVWDCSRKVIKVDFVHNDFPHHGN